MANSLTAFNPEYWLPEMQTVFMRENTAIALANTDFRDILRQGDTWHRPYMTQPSRVTYTKGTDVTVQDITATDESGTVATIEIVPFYIDDVDAIQNAYATAITGARRAQRLLNIALAQAVAGEVANANQTVDDGDIGGTDGNAIVVSTSNISNIFTSAARKLDDYNIPQSGRFALIGPRMLEQLRLYLSGKDTAMADIVGRNGLVMERFGFEIYYSNNIRFTATLGLATQVTEADTVVIHGVTFTFNATPSGAGSVDIGADAATSVDNLVAAVNDAGTVGTTYVQLTAQNRLRLEQAGIVATDGTTEMTIVAYGDITTSETLTDPTDAWSSQVQHNLFGLKGFTDLVVQKTPNVVFKDDPDRLGKNVFAWHLYGIQTFTDGDDMMVDVQLDASSWS